MTRHRRWSVTAVPWLPLLALALGAGAARAQDVPGTAVLLTGQEPSRPVPLLTVGQADQMLMDLVFLRLARLGPDLRVSGDSGFRPGLARRWIRRDSVTLAFDLDPRARWHDGRRVTARDVVTTLERARNPATGGRTATLLTGLAAVTAEGDRRVVVRFREAYAEQLYDAVYHVPPLPAHLVGALDAEAYAASGFARHPVGTGPFRWVRQVPGQFVELAGVRDHFLGRPGVARVIVRLAPDAETRLNLLFTGEADAGHGVVPPLDNLERIRQRGGLTVTPVASGTVGYVLFNFRDPDAPDRPHPILADPRVREAIGLGLDRETMVRAVFGGFAAVPDGPTSQLLWIRRLTPPPTPPDRAAAARLLDAAGWQDTDGDGIRDRSGRPLALRLTVPAPSAPRRAIALQMQEQLRPLGIRLEVQLLDGPVWVERRNAGQFDLDFSSAVQDPSPSGLRNSWTCATAGQAGANVGSYCNPAVDSAMAAARRALDGGETHWRTVLRHIAEDRAAIFLFAQATVYVRSARYRRAPLRGDSPYAELHEWQVDPAQALPRDRVER